MRFELETHHEKEMGALLGEINGDILLSGLSYPIWCIDRAFSPTILWSSNQQGDQTALHFARPTRAF